ncbi:MAG TPA: SDR family NAD(P)-dependent oxidoreductase, partial [Pseudonocardia sp.]|nr:SDR family NAD(P)-dependent oxidoreductase [Pseudonocardia sp.]
MSGGTTALVVGGTKGIGREIARLLAGEGADVTIVGRDPTAGDEAARRIGARFVRADVSLQSEVRRFAVEFTARHDRLHHLVHTADVITRGRRDTAEGVEV